jgi:hypothetical protein
MSLQLAVVLPFPKRTLSLVVVVMLLLLLLIQLLPVQLLQLPFLPGDLDSLSSSVKLLSSTEGRNSEAAGKGSRHREPLLEVKGRKICMTMCRASMTHTLLSSTCSAPSGTSS